MEHTETLPAATTYDREADTPRYRSFWNNRGTQAFWLTTQVGYRVGALLALLAHRLGIRPAVLTVLSVTTTALVTATVFFFEPTVAAAIPLALGLLLGYAFDCADGPLARVTGCASLGGALLDKTADLASSITITLCLCMAVAAHGEPLFHPIVVLLIVLPRPLMSVLIWLKEAHTHGDNRLRNDHRIQTRTWRIRRMAGAFSDEVVFRCGVAISWCTGHFKTFAIAYGLFTLTLAAAYLFATFNESRETNP